MTDEPIATEWFTKARYGLFIHYGLYSGLERGEWVMNRERIAPEAMRAMGEAFRPKRFDAEALCDLALAGGMRYVNLTTMHHDGFRLYETELSDFNAKHVCGRDLVEEFVVAARARGLRIALYHSLNNWQDQPDAAAALESGDAYDEFIGRTLARIEELVTRFNPIDVLWYDGWWPFNAERWKAVEMNAMVRRIQPHILFNGRNGLAGDFGTPEGHMTAPRPWRPWEACMTLNEHWGYHRGDTQWKTPSTVVGLLATAAQGQGNLLLNIGPRGDGSVPEASETILREVGAWLKRGGGEGIYATDRFTYGARSREGHRGDWSGNGPYTARGKVLYQLVRSWPGSRLVVAGLNTDVEEAALMTANGWRGCTFEQTGGVVTVTGLPDEAPDALCPVLRLQCRQAPEINLGGGMRIPKASHPPYDPCPSDMLL